MVRSQESASMVLLWEVKVLIYLEAGKSGKMILL
jgi:hypothetical protein